MRIVLRRASTLRGILLDDEGKGIGYGLVGASRDGKPMTSDAADGEGRFEIQVHGDLAVDLTFDGEVPEVRPAAVRRRVVPFRSRMEGVTVGLSSRAGEAVTGADGWARLRGLPALPLRLSLHWPATRKRPWVRVADRTLAPSGPDIVYRLRRGYVLCGRVRAPDGRGVPAIVRVRAGSRLVDEIHAAGDGGFLLVLDPKSLTGASLHVTAEQDGVTLVLDREGLPPDGQVSEFWVHPPD